MFIILGGLPGTGKSTIGRKIADKLKAVYLRIDSIEQAIKDASKYSNQASINIVAEGYMVACEVAKDNLALGLTVIADSVNPIEMTRADYRAVAAATNTPYIEIEFTCLNQEQHKHRIETRKSSIASLKQPTWQDVLDRDYEKWQSKHLTIDTSLYSEAEAVDLAISEISRRR